MYRAKPDTFGSCTKFVHVTPFAVQVQVKVCGAASGTATAVNCCVSPAPMLKVPGATAAGVTSVVMSTMVNASAPVTELSDANVAVMVGCTPAVVGAWKIAVVAVVEVKDPQGFGVPVHPVPVILHVTEALAGSVVVACSVRDWVG